MPNTAAAIAVGVLNGREDCVIKLALCAAKVCPSIHTITQHCRPAVGLDVFVFARVSFEL